jgi:hypothetical protein
MQLVMRRSQKTSGLMSKSVLFCLDARVDLSNEERGNVDRYRLGGQVLYNSAATEANLAKAAAGFAGGGLLKGAVGLALSRLTLSITVDSLTRGHHIECKELDELLGAEEAIKSAVETIKTYIDMASTFDGREIVIDLDEMATA